MAERGVPGWRRPSPQPRLSGRQVFAAALVLLALPLAGAQQTLKLSPTLTIEKTDDKVKTHDHVVRLLAHAREQKLEANVVRFLDNAVQQLQKVLEAAKTFAEQKATEVPKDFTPAKYRVKAMPKLQAKKTTVKKMAATELRKRLQEGKDINFAEPMLVTNASSLFEAGDWDRVKKHWSATRIMEDEALERDLRLEYWAPDKARARMVGNMLQMEEPDMVSFSRYLVICFHGSPAKPKLPGQNTEHCEQVVDATSMVHNETELAELQLFPEIKNALPMQAEFRRRLLEAGAAELPTLLGKGFEKWKKKSGMMSYRYFTFGPSGSGDKLHAENGLPFFDVLIHGSKRWLLMKEEEMTRVAEKAREALEFDKTSAYMFFEEKLPELREEFGLKKYMECNQQPGDMVIVPSGWYRVSVSLADSISYYETILSEKETLKAVVDNSVWRPQLRQYQLAYCYDPKDLHKLPGVEKGGQLDNWLKEAIAKVKTEEAIQGILSTMMWCGSTLSLDSAMPHMNIREGLTSCSPAAWKQCRSQLQAKIKQKGLSASLDWLPAEAPRSVDDIGSPAGAAKAISEEL